MPSDSVVLLHGLGRRAASLARMRSALTAEGYRVFALDYPSTRHDLPTLTATLRPKVAAIAGATAGAVHFVGHSMGGLLARSLIADARPDRLGRLVMLGPPNRGSEIADRLRHVGLYRRLLGPAALSLGTATVPVWPDPDYSIGVIAGSAAIPVVLNLLNRAYGFAGAPTHGIAGEPLAAPQATLITTIASGVIGGNLQWGLIGVGALVGAGLVLVDELLRRTGRFSLPPLGAALAIYLPSSVTVPVILGAFSGWVFDPDALGTAVPLKISVDGASSDATANTPRADINTLFRAGPNHGFSAHVPATLGQHSVCVTAVKPAPGKDLPMGCRTVTVVNQVPIGFLDSFSSTPSSASCRVSIGLVRAFMMLGREA